MMKISLFALATVLVGACAHQPKTAKDPQMERMAQMHSDMATCLRADKSFEDCHGQMMAKCQKEGAESCPMMKEHMRGGKMGMMNQPQTSKPEPQSAPANPEEHKKHHPEETP